MHRKVRAAGRAAQGCGCVSERQRIEPSRETAPGPSEDVMTERQFGGRERGVRGEWGGG